MFNVYLFSSTPRPITTTAPNQIFTEPSEDSDNAFFGLQIQNEAKEVQVGDEVEVVRSQVETDWEVIGIEESVARRRCCGSRK